VENVRSGTLINGFNQNSLTAASLHDIKLNFGRLGLFMNDESKGNIGAGRGLNGLQVQFFLKM
jgi:hypothetical protein